MTPEPHEDDGGYKDDAGHEGDEGDEGDEGEAGDISKVDLLCPLASLNSPIPMIPHERITHTQFNRSHL